MATNKTTQIGYAENTLSRKKTYPKKKKRGGCLFFFMLLLTVIVIVLGIEWLGIPIDYKSLIINPINESTKNKEVLNEREAKEDGDQVISDEKATEQPAIPENSELLYNDNNKLSYTDYLENIQYTNGGQIITLTRNDQTINRFGQLDYFIQVPKTTYAKDNFVSLRFSHSPLLIESKSTLTVTFNDQPLSSIFLSSETQNLSSLEIPISAELLTEGFHKISVIYNGKIDEALCGDNVDPANWLTLHQTSFFHLNSNEMSGDIYQLEDFPYPFVQVGRKNPINNYIVIPNQPDEDTLKAALKISHSLYNESERAGEFEIVTENELATKKEARHLIVIGFHDHFTGIINDILVKKGIQAEENGITIKTAWLSKLQRQLLYVGGTEGSLSSLIDVLTIKSLADQLSGKELTINKLPTVRKSNQSGPSSFADLGVNNIVLSSMMNVSPSIYYEIPPQWNVTDAGILRLRLRISAILKEGKVDTNQLLGLTIHLNNEPFTISLQTLLNEMDELGYVDHDVIIPRTILMKNEIVEIKFSFNLINQEINCIRNDDSSRWLQINNTSFLDVPFIEADGSKLADWPAPFVGNQDLNHLAFIIPNEITGKRLSQLAYLLSHLSTQLMSVTNFEIIQEQNLEKNKQRLEDYHLIILNDAVDNKENTNELFLNETVAYTVEYARSSINKSKVQITFRGIKQEKADFPFFHRDILSYLHSQDFDSNLLIMSKSGYIVTGEEPIPKAPYTSEEPISLFILLVVIFSIAITIVVILLLYFLKKKQKKE